MDENLYAGREQSWVKHIILERYLLEFALIIGRTWKSITYVDCFSGPWKSQSESFQDTSFAIAIEQLRKAKDRLAQDGISIELRAFFIEQNKQSFTQLKEYVTEIQDIEIDIRNAELEDSVDEIRSFIDSSRKQTFPFIFIDPTGWTGYALDVIRPLLALNRCEMLINFMTQHIIRFINNKMSRESFRRLFGSEDFIDELAGTKKEDRVDKAVFQYRKVVGEVGGFKYPGVAGILNPKKNMSHFHLIYLSRHPTGLEVFKGVEKKSMPDMESARARVEQTHRESKTGQLELFTPDEAPESKYYESLKTRYLNQAISRVEELLHQDRRLSYDVAWHIWLQYPLVWESDLKAWVKSNSQRIKCEGLKPGKRALKRGENHFLILDTDP